MPGYCFQQEGETDEKSDRAATTPAHQWATNATNAIE
jgi:hypothetical protein